MTPNEYQDKTKSTAVYAYLTEEQLGRQVKLGGIMLLALKMASEAGLVYEMLKKALRGDREFDMVAFAERLIDTKVAINVILDELDCVADGTPPHGVDEETVAKYRGLAYLVLGLNGESAEVAALVVKALEGEGLDRAALLKEWGDQNWYSARGMAESGFTLEEVMAANLEKLAQRKAAGTLRGSGSDR